MYSVSDDYLTAAAAPSRIDRITGTITLSSGTEIEVANENIARNSLSINSDVIDGGGFDIGTFNTAEMRISIFDADSLQREFSNAVIELSYGLLVGADTWEDVPLGIYNVDGTACSRVRDRVNLIAHDNSVAFDVEIPSNMRTPTYTAYSALVACCAAAGITLASDSAAIGALPNSSVTFTFANKQLQTLRDCVMWTAQLLCSHAIINRGGELTVKKARYDSVGETITVTREFTAAERKNLNGFSDTRTYVKKLSAYSNKKTKHYTATITYTDVQAEKGSFELPDNPLLSEKSEADCDTINTAFANFAAFLQRYINVTTYGNPEMDLLDTVAYTGGNIDVRGRIVGVLTQQKWKYRGGHTLISDNPPALEEA